MNNWEAAPKDGEQKCAYCYDIHPESEMIRKTVRHHPKQRNLDKPRWYCKDKGCAGYHQMSLEG